MERFKKGVDIVENSKRIKKILVTRLKDAGLDNRLIPGFIRSVANSVFVAPHNNLWQINERLQYLGWDNFKLDYHTLQLAIAYFESEGLRSLENIQGFLFDRSFMTGSSCLDRGAVRGQ